MLQRLGKDIAIYGVSDFSFRLVGLAVFPIYAHLFSVEEFGIMALVTTAASLIAVVANLGLNSAVQRFYWDPQTSIEHRPILVSTGLMALGAFSALLVATLLAVLYPARELISERYSIPWLILALGLMAIVPEQLVQYALDTLRLHFSPWKFALVSFLKNLAGVILGLVLVIFFAQALAGIFMGALIAAAAVAPLALFLIRRDVRLAFDVTHGRRLIEFGFPLVFAGLAYWVFGALDRWMLAELSDNEQVGLYSIAFKFASVVLILTAAFGQAWSPMAIRLMREKPESYRADFSRVLTLWSLALALTACTVGLFGFEVLVVLTPEPYWRADSALAVLAAATAVGGTIQLTATGISLARKTRLIALGSWLAAALNVALNFALIPGFGAEGAAIATLATYTALTTFFLWWSQSLHPMPLEWRKLALAAGFVLGTLVLLPLVGEPRWSIEVFAIKLALFAGILAVGLRYIVGPSEARRLLSMLRTVKA